MSEVVKEKRILRQCCTWKITLNVSIRFTEGQWCDFLQESVGRRHYDLVMRVSNVK